jgi:GAF domain-containing protein
VGGVPSILERLLRETGASRVTLRRGSDGDYAFPVTDEALAPGAGSLRAERTVDLRTQPVAVEVRQSGQVVQDDSRTAFDDPEFQRMLDVYGGVVAQIVTAVESDGEVAAILSVHQLGRPRRWTRAETDACRLAAEELATLL